jgi:hypothetical protein
MRKQVKLLSGSKDWSENARYKVNEVVTYNDYNYQNITGANSTPDDLTDWINIGSSGAGLVPTLQEVINEGGLSNGSTLKQGAIDAGYGGSKGIALQCAVGYELKWESGRLYVMNDNGTIIRDSLYNFTITPQDTDDETKGFAIGSRWILDNGSVYVCSDATGGAAVWVLQKNVNTIQQYKTANFTAEYGVYYVVNASATITDPTPVDGYGYIFYVLRGTVTAGGLNYAPTSLVYRYYSFGAWITKDVSNLTEISDINTALGNRVQVGVNNSTTLALTSANLNSTYPSATTGFRVYCVAIIAGAMVYEKTTTGWIGTAVTIP